MQASLSQDEARSISADVAKLPELLQRRSNKAVLTVVGAVYGGVNLSWRRAARICAPLIGGLEFKFPATRLFSAVKLSQ